MKIVEGDALAVGLEEEPGRAGRKSRRQQVLRAQASPQCIPPSRSAPLSQDQANPHEIGGIPDGEAQWQQYFERACACIDANQYHLAISLLIRVVRNAEGHSSAWHRLGFAYGELGRHRRAIDCFNRVIELSPEWSEGWVNRGWNRIRLRDYQGAVIDLMRAVDIAPDRANAWNNLGLAYSKLGRFDKAAEAHEQACACEPNNESFSYRFALSLARIGDRENAVHWLKRSCELNPMYLRAWLQLAIRIRRPAEWPRPAIVPNQAPVDASPSIESPNAGRILRRESQLASNPVPRSQQGINRLWETVQNPVAWILVFIVAALIYTLLGN